MTKQYVYVHAGTFIEFQEYKLMNLEFECIYIVNDITLRGRTPGKVVWIGTYSEKFEHHAISESIDTHIEIWREGGFYQDEDGAIKDKTDKDGRAIDGYGV